MRMWNTLKSMIQNSGATSLLEFKMSFSEEIIAQLIASYGKTIFDLVTVMILNVCQNISLHF